MSDSDIRVTSDFLGTIAAEFQDPRLGVSSCPYRAVPGRSFWSILEAIGMNTEFLSGVIVARMLEGVKFALGPTATARKQVLSDIGGWNRLKDYLAEDFVLGNFAAEKGWGVILSSYVIEHHIGSQPFLSNARHRLRWFRSTRRSRPSGYVGQLFTNPLPLALLFWIVQPEWWAVAVRHHCGPRLGCDRDRTLDPARPPDGAPLVSCSGSRLLELCILDRRLLRQCRHLARTSLPADEGRHLPPY